MKRIRWYDYITINIYWLGLTTVSQANGLIQPLLIQKFVGTEQQGTMYGNLRLYTLMVALLVQALAGMLSDRSTLRWGRRRPFILVGTLLNMACIIAIGASPSYWFLFGAAVLSQIASNTAHGAEQGLIPDLVPEDRRGIFSGVKSVMDLLPVIIVALTIGKLIAAGLVNDRGLNAAGVRVVLVSRHIVNKPGVISRVWSDVAAAKIKRMRVGLLILLFDVLTSRRHQRRLDGRRAPVRVRLLQQGGNTGNMGRCH